MSARSELEREADRADHDLFMAKERVRVMLEKVNAGAINVRRDERHAELFQAWLEIGKARAVVRGFMSEADRARSDA